MKTARIAKTLSTAALVSLALMAGSSHANDYSYRANASAPEFNHPVAGPGYGPGLDHGFGPQRNAGLSIDQRQRVMMARIDHGVRTGQLTRSEANDLRKDLRRTEWLERRFEADGRLDRGERMELDRLLDKLSRHLHEEMHDNDMRGGRQAWR
jgi:hypothetical protein